MATFLIFRSTLPICFLFFYLLTLYPISSQSLVTLITGNSNFDPQIVLLGDATISDDGSRVQLTSPNASSSGLLLHKNPFKFLSSNAGKKTSFSTEFVFSFTGNAVGLSLVLGPYNFESKFLGQGPLNVSEEKGYLGFEFGVLTDSNVGDSNTSIVSVTVDNEPSTHFITKSGEKLRSWIDYDASSRRLEVRLSKLSDKRPYNPIMAYSIDLYKMWEDNEVYVGLGSKHNGNLSDKTYVYSWRFKLRKIPYWMHSLPVNPNASKDNSNEIVKVQRRKFCPLTILAGMIFATGCGALLAFAVLFVWAIFVSRRTVFPIEGDVQPVDFRYQKVCVVVEKDENVVKN